MLGTKVKVFTPFLRGMSQYNGREGVVVATGGLCRFSPADQSLSKDVKVRISESTTITVPEGAVTILKH